MIKIKRAYDEIEDEDGTRILVDRLWPRGITKKKFDVEEWMKDIAPSTKLIKWFGHKPEKWGEFRKKYKEELKEKRELLFDLKRISRRGRLTLIYAAKDRKMNNAVVLKEVLDNF